MRTRSFPAGQVAVFALALASLAGCASANTQSAGSASRQDVVFSGPDVTTILADRPTGIADTLASTSVDVLTAARKVYTLLDIPVAVDDARAHQVGNADFYKTRQFGGKPMASFVDCGSGLTGPNASTYRIFMSLLTTATDNVKGGTTIVTTLRASARDVAGGASTDRIPCSTNGRLETLVNDRVKAAVRH